MSAWMNIFSTPPPLHNEPFWTTLGDARRIVAEDVLIVAERLSHRPLTTGHLLIAILESPDEHTSEITNSLHDVREIATAVIDALPGEEET
jgi:hypothetical protein